MKAARLADNENGSFEKKSKRVQAPFRAPRRLKIQF